MKPDLAASEQSMDHFVIHRDPHAYSAHPHMAVVASNNWLLVFTQSRRRAGVLHPPQDPLYCNMLTRSADEGRSWSAPSVVPDFGWQGVECAGLTPLGSGAVLLNQWRFGWHTLSHAEHHLPRQTYTRPEDLVGPDAMSAELSDWTPEIKEIAQRYPWVRSGGETWAHRSFDGGLTFAASTKVDTAPFSGGYGMRGGIEINGEIVLPLSDVPNYAAIFTVRSRDGGSSWSTPDLVAAGEGHAFEEPAPIVLSDGRIVMLLRDNNTRILHVVHSDDAGRSWSKPETTGIADYPADMIELADGRIACVAGRRRAPFGIALYVSDDGGRSWNPDTPLAVRQDLPNRDLGYPTVARRADGSLYVAYYAQDSEGITGIHASVVPADVLARGQEGQSHGQR